VFNCQQIDGLPRNFTAPAGLVLDPVARIAGAQSFFRNTGDDNGSRCLVISPIWGCVLRQLDHVRDIES
jgi:hypothetical protein